MAKPSRVYLRASMKSVINMWMVIGCVSLFGTQTSSSHTSGEIKEWHLSSQHGFITFKLFAIPNAIHGNTVLVLEPEGHSMPGVLEEAALLKQVLNAMTSHGYDPQKMATINTWLQNTEYQEGVEHSLVESGGWKSCVGRKYCHEAEVIANRYLKSINAFKSFDDVLQAHGLVKRSIKIDDMGIGRKSGRISCSGLVIITLNSKK